MSYVVINVSVRVFLVTVLPLVKLFVVDSETTWERPQMSGRGRQLNEAMVRRTTYLLHRQIPYHLHHIQR